MLTALGVGHSFKRIRLASCWANSKLGGMGDQRGDWVLQTRTAGTEAETWCLWCCWRRHRSSGRARAFCLLLGINLQGFMPFLLGTMHNILACYLYPCSTLWGKCKTPLKFDGWSIQRYTRVPEQWFTLQGRVTATPFLPFRMTALHWTLRLRGCSWNQSYNSTFK